MTEPEEPRYTLAEAQRLLHHTCNGSAYSHYYKPGEAITYLECRWCKNTWTMTPFLPPTPPDWGTFYVRTIGA